MPGANVPGPRVLETSVDPAGKRLQAKVVEYFLG
jgi:hypothetical protein